MRDLSIRALVAAQRERDRRAAVLFPQLAAIKRARMVTSPHTTLRGAAPLYYDILGARPALAEGPPGEGWIVGDLHLVGRAHRRAAAQLPRRAWTDRELAGLVDRAIELTGIHESVALELARPG